MELKRLVIKNYGKITELDYKPKDSLNCVNETVSNAICHVLNNRFAIRHYNRVKPRADTYLFGEMHHYKKGTLTKYTAEIKGFDEPIFTKNGEKMTDEQVDNDPILSRPYREDNACIYCAHTQNSFLDCSNFLAPHFFRLSDYAQSFKACIENKTVLCNIVKDYVVSCDRGKPLVYRRVGKTGIRPVEDLSECDKLCADYTTFTLLVQMIDYHQQYNAKNGVVTSTPLIVNGVRGGLDEEELNAKLLLYKTRGTGRQTFFVEKRLRELEELIKELE